MATKHCVTCSTFQIWKKELDCECETVTWLTCEVDTKGHKKTVSKLRCSVCVDYKERICSRRNFSDKWFVGADSIRTSNIRDHAKAEQHKHAMNLFRRDQASASGSDSLSSGSIQGMLCHLSPSQRTQLQNKFDIAYLTAIEKIPFRKYPRICELEARHRVSIGTAYTNEVSCKTFTHYIADAKRKELLDKLKVKFVSVLMDGSTDKGNVDDELFMAVWCEHNSSDERIHTKTTFFHVEKPKSVDGSGLFESLKNALLKLEIVIETSCSKLVGIGTDGASANIASGGLRGFVESKCSWIFWMWCLAHRLELAVKEVMESTIFDMINDVLLKLYYLYEKATEKCRELEEIVNDLKGCVVIDEQGVRPIRASGSRWVSHKLNAMKHVLSKYGAYTSHLIALSEDSSIKSTDRAKFSGYCKQWLDAKYLLGCAAFVDILTPYAVFSKVMQSDELNILGALISLVQTMKETDKLQSLPLCEWPSYSATLKKVNDEGGKKVYQCQELKRFDTAKQYYQENGPKLCQNVNDCLQSRMEWSDMQLVRDIIGMLATQGWEKLIEENDPLDHIDRLTTHFGTHLKNASADCLRTKEEVASVIEYACNFISLSTLHYCAVWWRIFNVPSASEWSNALTLAELLFSLPASNELERVFSQLNVIKTEKRTSLTNDSLDDLIMVTSTGIPMSDFSPDKAINMWWRDKIRCPNQRKQKRYTREYIRVRDTESDTESETEIDTTDNEQWDSFFK